MTSHAVVRTGGLPRVPWKNGAGTTREVAVFPSGAGPDDFWWRISVADIVQDGAFSVFAGADRHFLLASAGTLAMDVDGEPRTAAYGRTEAFPGEADVSVQLSAGPTSVINLITNRAFCRGFIDVQHIDGPHVPDGNAVALALLDGAAWADGERLQPLDFLTCGQGTEGILFKEAIVATVSVLPS